ncbi:Uu.00g060960.m01.CDS01 [Anthostomella pinea]|uniref:Uu.00g060960.m01.CDS01 n=1 Tax=Anthostomella pinea TaxID=933095 RepID=A0AAI8VSB2_9PEZI|nr:Uu.00g060960.m01.CDS01 [Anthostomella pinea]
MRVPDTRATNAHCEKCIYDHLDYPVEPTFQGPHNHEYNQDYHHDAHRRRIIPRRSDRLLPRLRRPHRRLPAGALQHIARTSAQQCQCHEASSVWPIYCFASIGYIATIVGAIAMTETLPRDTNFPLASMVGNCTAVTWTLRECQNDLASLATLPQTAGMWYRILLWIWVACAVELKTGAFYRGVSYLDATLKPKLTGAVQASPAKKG